MRSVVVAREFVTLDSADHKSHMASPQGGACPVDHPVAIPVISFNIHYPVPTDGATLAWALSSDDYDTSGGNAGNSGHGDYAYGWNTPTLETFTQRCIEAAVDCHDYLLGDGRTLY